MSKIIAIAILVLGIAEAFLQQTDGFGVLLLSAFYVMSVSHA